MSDPNLEEESLISQDDIDKLLDSSSIEEAEERLENGNENSPDLDELGELSQDDIDNLLTGSTLDTSNGEPLENSSDDEMGELSQDDIDSLMGGNDSVDAEDEDEVGELSQDDIDSLMGGNDSVDAEDDDEMGELSQDDIDGLMGGNDPVDVEDIDTPTNRDTDMETGDDQDMELISQDDIDQLMNPSTDDPLSENEGSAQSDSDDPEDEENADELISMDDVQNMMDENENKGKITTSKDETAQLDDEDEIISQEVSSGEPVTNETSEPDPPGEGVTDSDDYVIDEADALDVSQCLITQETLDALIKNVPTPEEVPDPVALDSEPEPEVPMEDMASEDSTPGPVVLDENFESEPISLDEPGPPEQGPTEQGLDVPGEDDLELAASSDELEDLLNTDLDDAEFDMGSPDSDVTQEDIDALLQESDEDEDLLDDGDDILISQDDIDTLLMAADQEDEDLLGDLMGDDMDAGLDDDFEDEDILDSDGEESPGYGGDQVVLEGGDDAGEEEGDSPSSDKRWKNWYKSKLVIATASAILVLGICVPSVYFLFFSQKPAQLPEIKPVPVAMEELGRDIEVASVDINAGSVLDFKKSGNIVLTNFVILASDLSKDMAYVTADISIDYSDQRAYHEINDHLSFYRDLIYESIQKNLVWEKRNEVTEADLIWGIETTLKKVLPSDYIERVSFKSFKAS